MDEANEAWPLHRVRVTTPRMELRLPTDDELRRLLEHAVAGIHDPAVMPFASPWSDSEPDELRRAGYQWHMKCRAEWSADSWTMLLVAFVDGEPVGAQDIIGRSFGIRREAATGSWLARSYQGRGLGREMREAVLHLAFEGLGALSATSGAYTDNPASIAVSDRCGYELDGRNVLVRRRGPRAPGGVSAERAVELRFRLDRSAWLERRRDDIEITGLDDDLLAMFGVRADAD